MVGLDGFRVVGDFDIEKFECGELSAPAHQLAILLYPQELINEKFLISIRSCMLKLPENHPVKKWLKHNSSLKKTTSKVESQIVLLSDLLNSPFNLITDFKVKNNVVELIADCPEHTFLEKVLKSYLFLMIGNVTKSDNILRTIILTPPREMYKGYKYENSFFHKVAAQNLDKIFVKFSRHPADRRIFELFLMYITSFMNDPALIAISNDVKTGAIDGKLGVEFTERIAPDLVRYLRFTDMTQDRRVKNLMDVAKYPLPLQSYWIWAFTEESPIYSVKIGEELRRVEASDPLWVIFLLDDERAADLYLKQGGELNIQRKRQLLRMSLSGDDFMMVLYKLVQLGDIDSALIEKVSEYLTHE